MAAGGYESVSSLQLWSAIGGKSGLNVDASSAGKLQALYAEKLLASERRTLTTQE